MTRSSAQDEALIRSTTGYQPQLDGLRAIAVMSVMVFHARPELLPGGFIGVDIFFVLSGFLITRIIMKELKVNKKFSFKRFYMRRALRLFPALFLACVVLLVVYSLIPGLPQHDETLFGIFAAVTYSSSWFTAFSIADLGAMLPTWSLSVEEHFYFVWPLVLVLLFRFSKFFKASVVLLILIATTYPLVAFVVFDWSVERLHYAPDTRSAQLLIGCGAAILVSKAGSRVPSLVAWFAILFLVGYELIKNLLNFDFYNYGGNIMIGVMTAIFILHLDQQEYGLFSRLLSTRPMVWIGQRSYGIYLWNLPLIAVMTFMGSSLPGVAAKLAVCFIIPAISFTYVEKPLLRLKRRFDKQPDRTG
ncbi:acyltransferase family protein [Paeniglutamicibacter psychrophenolicus]|uniref:Peptidoglycan/LPS O-acetylase OafA/YrhL n=1 Tax=Paeniglutamicibacter psychrophenolicus TaxID=257454 RepID=A0ABS4WI82_9MICC|nr:acyltransferase [Paeniglutamicibacter psychrophenolicus]MBP2375915.1 peptidoglycan/LPS O-acetylase OafA/YrhL [Paeniglutamicibacter psychrophenolicus]